MQKISFIFIFLLAFLNTFAQTWQPVVSGTNRNLHDVSITQNNTIYACSANYYGDNDFMQGNDILLRSFDNGTTWDSMAVPMYLKDIFFVNDSVGLFSGGLPSCGMAPSVLKTNDKGVNWNGFQNQSTWNVPWSVSMGYSATYFWEKDKGYIFGGTWGAEQYKTLDEGANWTLINRFHCQNSYPDVFFFNEMQGFLVCDSTQTIYDSLGQIIANQTFGYIYKTIDGGINWNMQVFPNDSVIDVHFPSQNVGYVTAGAHLLKTTDGGTTWNSLNVPFLAQKLAFINDDRGYIVAKDGNIYKTSDGGLNWTLDYTGNFFAIEAKKGVGFAVGKNGSIIRFNNATSAISPLEASASFVISPNPSADLLKIETPYNGTFAATLTNDLGQTIFAGNANNSLIINMKSFANATYFLSIKDKNGKILQTEKIIKQ